MKTEERIELLRTLIEKASDEINEGSTAELEAWAHRFEEEGIEPEMHVGRNEDMAAKTPEAELLTLEWFAGALLDIHVRKAYFAVQSWVNMSDTILAEEVED